MVTASVAPDDDNLTRPATTTTVYPSSGVFPNRVVARRARILMDSSSVVFVGRSGRVERTIPVHGEGGVDRVVHVNLPDEPAIVYEQRRPAYETLAGALDFLDRAGEVTATVPLVSWFPALRSGQVWADRRAASAAAYRHTGLGQQFQSAGLAVKKVNSLDHPLVGDRRRLRGAYVARFEWAYPSWLLRFAWFAPLVAVLAVALGFTTTSVLLLAGALLLLVSPVLFTGALAGAWLAEVASRPRAAHRLQAAPAGVSSRRFRHCAAVLVVDLPPGTPGLVAAESVPGGRPPREIGFVDGAGRELWLPLGGPGIVSCTTLRSARSGRPTAAQFGFSDGRPAATLPWQHWFDGAGDGDEAAGATELAEFVARAGLSSGERVVEDDDPALTRDANFFRPLSAADAARTLDAAGLRPPGVLLLAPALFAIMIFVPTLVLPLFGEDVDGWTFVGSLLGSLAGALSVLPYLVRWGWRQWWDRPSGES